MEAATHSIAHLLREVESALRAVLEPVGAVRAGQPSRHGAVVRAVLGVLNISEDDVVAKTWLGMTADGSLTNLARYAHRSALEAPRPIDAEFRKFVDDLEQVFDVVLERFETDYTKFINDLDELLGSAVLTVDTARRFRQRLPNNLATLRHLFRKAPASWVGPLRDAGFFATPPPAQPDVEGGIFFPEWPPSAYLARIASDGPGRVTDIAVGIAQTDNVRVHQDLLAIAADVPAPLSSRLTDQLVAALNRSFGLFRVHQVGALVVHLCDGGESDSALRIATALCARHPARAGGTRPGSAYEFGLVLHDQIPKLVEAVGMPALTMLIELLAAVVVAESPRHERLGGWDGSSLWRPDLSTPPARASSDPRHSMIDAVRDAAVQLIDSRQITVGDAVSQLESRKLPICQRMALHVLSRYPDQAPDLVAVRLADSRLASAWEVSREYLDLARAGAPVLDSDGLRRLLTLIEGGPHPTDALNLNSADGLAQANAPLARSDVPEWQRDRLTAIQAVLPPEWNARLHELDAEYGQAEDPIPHALRNYGPVDDDDAPNHDFASMTPDAIVQALRDSPPPDDDNRGIRIASIRGSLTRAIESGAPARSSQAASFVGLPPEYVGAVVNGLRQAATNDTALDWSQIITLCVWIDDMAQQELDAGTRDPDSRLWREPRVEMLRLLARGMDTEPSPVSPDADSTIWSIIERSCGDPDPVAGAPSGLPSPVINARHAARTSVRPLAVRTVISFGLRLHRRPEQGRLEDVLALLAKHSDRWQDASPAVRCIYGELFPQLAWMDRDWARDHVDVIFPLEIDQAVLLEAAWTAYMYRGPIPGQMELLKDRYAWAVNRLADGTDEARDADDVTQLGVNLLAGFWAGHFGLEDDSPLRRFYALVSPERAAALTAFISHNLDPETPMDPDLRTRLVSLWEFRSAEESSTSLGEISEFGLWFASGHFDEDWSLKHLLRMLRRTGDLQYENEVCSRLAVLASSHVQSCLAVVLRWIEKPREPWRILQCMDDISTVLSAGLAGDVTATDTARKIISQLFLLHDVDMRHLIPPEPSA